MDPKTKVTEQQIERWKALAAQASQPDALLMEPGKHVAWRIIQGEDCTLVASGMRWQDGAFMVEARQAVLGMATDLELLRSYAQYVAECVHLGERVLRQTDQVLLPMTFDEWLVYRAVEQAR